MQTPVLVIDTDTRALQSTSVLLEDAGCDVIPASSFPEFHEALAERRARLIVIEPVLQGIDGYELCRALLLTYAKLDPVVILASHRVSGAVHSDKATEVGARAFIERPTMDDELLGVVREILAEVPAGSRPAAVVPAPAARPRRRGLRWLAAFATAGAAALILIPAMRSELDRKGSAGGTPTTSAPAMGPHPVSPFSDGGKTTCESGDGEQHELLSWEAAQALTTRLGESADTEPTIAPRENIALPLIKRSPPVLIDSTRVEPQYPERAQSLGHEGRVLLGAVVRVDGTLDGIEILEQSDPDVPFGRSAIDAVRHWKYRPASQDGAPVEARITIEVAFQP